jgi:hypothetical protein
MSERLVHGCGFRVGGILDYAPDPALQVLFFVRAHRPIAGGASVCQAQDIAAKPDF